MSLRAKIQNNSFVKHIVSNKRLKRMFLSSESHNGDFYNILFFNNCVSYRTSHYVEFHDRRQNSLGGEKSQRIHRSGRIRASLTPLNNLSKEV